MPVPPRSRSSACARSKAASGSAAGPALKFMTLAMVARFLPGPPEAVKLEPERPEDRFDAGARDRALAHETQAFAMYGDECRGGAAGTLTRDDQERAVMDGVWEGPQDLLGAGRGRRPWLVRAGGREWLAEGTG